MNRRQVLLAGLAMPVPLRFAGAGDVAPVYIADMHFHSFFFRPDGTQSRPLRRAMAAGNVTLLSWSLVGDVPWLEPQRGSFVQKGAPHGQEAVTWFAEEISRIKAHLAEQNLPIVLSSDHVDAALRGEPHVVLSVEGATFADQDGAEIDAVYAQRVRHIQLVHYIRTTLGDFQTAGPVHGGLTERGRGIIRACNRLGILIDLAHCSDKTVEQALTETTAPVVWSHSSIARPGPRRGTNIWQVRQLSLDLARAIARNGGVVGLWALGSDIGRTPESYAERLAEAAAWIGEDHVAIGTDLHALGAPAVRTHEELSRVIAHWRRSGMADATIRKIAIGNYARVLKDAFAARKA